MREQFMWLQYLYYHHSPSNNCLIICFQESSIVSTDWLFFKIWKAFIKLSCKKDEHLSFWFICWADWCLFSPNLAASLTIPLWENGRWTLVPKAFLGCLKAVFCSGKKLYEKRRKVMLISFFTSILSGFSQYGQKESKKAWQALSVNSLSATS